MITKENRLIVAELQQLRKTDFSTKLGFVKEVTVLAREVGETGSPERAENAHISAALKREKPICSCLHLFVSQRH